MLCRKDCVMGVSTQIIVTTFAWRNCQVDNSPQKTKNAQLSNGQMSVVQKGNTSLGAESKYPLPPCFDGIIFRQYQGRVGG